MPYWLDTAPLFCDAATGPLPSQADVAIVGAGFTGLSAALALAKAGASVVLLDAERVAGGASGRNGGQCNNGLAGDLARLMKTLGADAARAYYRAYDTAVDTVERIVREENVPCDFSRCGKIKLAAKPAHFEKLARAQGLLAEGVDPETELVDRAHLSSEVGSDHYFGGLLFKKSAGMHMGRFAKGLADAATRYGAAIYEHAPVTALQRQQGHRYDVVTRKGTVRAEAVLLATGASLQGPFGRLRRRMVPVGSFIIVTAPLPVSVVESIMPTRRMATDTRNVGSYFRITPDNRLLFGGRARFAMSNPLSDAKSGRILEKAMVRVFPQLAGVPIDYCWGGLVDMTMDRLPRAGEHEGIFYSVGYSGHGTQMATHMGTVMAEVIGGASEANIWRDLAWPAIPGHFGRPWFLPLVGAYYRLQDVLH